MQPWTPEEIAQLNAYLAPARLDPQEKLVLMENPLDRSKSFLSADFYSGDFPRALADSIPVNLTPRTDDNPYFGELRKHLGLMSPDPKKFIDAGTAYALNISIVRGIPMDEIHLFVTAAASAIFVLLFIFVPLGFSAVGRQEGAAALPLLTYFSCLGAGFITLELVFIQKFMNLIGSPLYTYSTVIFAMLFGAGIGSASSEKLGISSQRRWAIPFVAIIAIGLALVVLYPRISHLALALPLFGRILVSSALIFPLGFFLGMPFPLGILAVARQPRGAVAWAWGMNGLFTVVGGLASVVMGLWEGFNFAILVALLLYVIAVAVYRPMRDTVPHAAEVLETGVPPAAAAACRMGDGPWPSTTEPEKSTIG
jgi:hypothetical protein